jgi:hypothetical protein
MILESYINLALIISASFCLAPFGRLLKVRGLFQESLVGISLVGLVVASLANFSAGLIRPFVLAMIIVGLTLTIKDFRKNRLHIWLYLLLILAGASLLIVNNPIKLFISDNSVLFNSHYAYYANQATEMLTADYYSRLKVAEFMPYAWSRYHFFNASAQAAVQGFVPYPNLLSYFSAQIIITIVSLLAVLEAFFGEFKFNLKTSLLSIAFIVIGFTLFSNSVAWNLITTGNLTVASTILIFLAIYKKDISSYLVYAVIFGASAFRLLPLSLIAFALLAIYLFRKKQLSLKSIGENIYFWLTYVFFALYNVLTLVMGKPNAGSEMSLLNAKFYYHDGWIYPLTSYKLAGMAAHLRGMSLFTRYSSEGYANISLSKKILLPLLVIVAITVLVFVVKYVIDTFKESRLKLIVIAIVLAALGVFFLRSPMNLKLLLLFTVPYLIIVPVFIHFLSRSLEERRNLTVFYLSLTIGAILFQFAPVSIEVKAPLLFVMCDIGLWSVLGLYLFSKFKAYPQIILALAFAAILIPMFNLHLKGMLSTDSKTVVNIKPLLASSYKRADFVGADRKCKLSLDRPEAYDAYSTFIGCTLDYSEQNKGFLSHDFVAK